MRINLLLTVILPLNSGLQKFPLRFSSLMMSARPSHSIWAPDFAFYCAIAVHIWRHSCAHPSRIHVALVNRCLLFIAARSELRQVLFLALCVTFCLCMKYLGNRWTDLHQIPKEDVFGPSLGWVWMSRSKGKAQGHQGQKTTFWGPFGDLRAVYVW